MNKRQVIFDTETTGLDPNAGHRVTEIGCVEVIDFIPTGQELRLLVNPERDIPADVTEVTGHTWEMVKDEPKFAEIAERFLAFIKDSELVAHNAGFDRGFINMELTRCGKPEIDPARFIDTAALARKKFPGAPASLDALCKRFDISLESRTKHGALIDAYLLAEVYLELNGGREQGLAFAAAPGETGAAEPVRRRPRPKPLPSRVSETERAAHDAFVGEMDNALWSKLGLLAPGNSGPR